MSLAAPRHSLLLEPAHLSIFSKANDLNSSESPLDPTSSTPSTISEETVLIECTSSPVTVELLSSYSASFSWNPLTKIPGGLVAVNTVELQQLDNSGSTPGTNWVCVYKGSGLSCKAENLKAGRSYAVRLCVHVESHDSDGPEPGFEVRVQNAEHVHFNTPATVPSVIQPPALAQRARNALKLKWNVPEDAGGVFELTYVLHISPAPLGLEDLRAHMGFVEVYRGPERSFKVTKLQPGVRYTARVQAVNQLGEGPFSLCSAYTTQATVPAVPEPPTVQSSAATSMTLTWSPPADNGSPIICYSLERDDGAGGDFNHAYAGPNTSHTVKGLKAGTSYRFRLRADNDEGRSMWSTVALLSTGAAPPDCPQSVQVVSASRTSATMAWRAPDDEGGSSVLAFEVELQAKSRAATACMGSEWLKIFEGEAHACTINSLRPGCAYRVRVRARNAAGWGGWSLPVDLTTAADVPEVPLTLQPSSCSPSTIVITWAPPRHDGGAQVHMYHMEMAPADLGQGAGGMSGMPGMSPHMGPPLGSLGYPGAPPPPPPPPLPAPSTGPRPCPGESPLLVYAGETVGAEVRHLQPGCHYVFRVQAVNAQGASAWTEWVAASTLADVPVTPAPPAVAGVAPTALMLSWQVPPCQGSPVTHYTVEAAQLPQGPGVLLGAPGPAGIIADPRVAASLTFKPVYSGPHPGCEVRGLESYCGYAFRVCAHNDMGPSPWSVCAAAITGHAPPTCPKLASAQAASSSKLVLCWAPPERDHGAPVMSYTMEMAQARSGSTKANAAQWTHLFTGPACACTAEGLAPGRAYQFRVRAANMCGLGPWAPVVIASTLPAAPAAVGKPSITARSATGFRAKWDEPEANNGAPVTSYVLQVSPCGMDEWTVAYSGSEGAAKVSGMQPGTKYLLRAAAVNSAGQGPFGEAEVVTTMLLPPSAPHGLRVVQVAEAPLQGALRREGDSMQAQAEGCSLASAVVAWDEPATSATQAAVMGYEVLATPKSGSEAAAAPGGGVVKLNQPGRNCQACLQGLALGSQYTVRVRAVGVDGAGHSGWSEELPLATPARPDADALSTSSGGQGAQPISGVSQRRGAGRKAGKKQQAAAAAALSFAASASGEEVSVAASRGNAGRGKAGEKQRLAAAATTVAAKTRRKQGVIEMLLERCPGDGVMTTIAGEKWRRDVPQGVKFCFKWIVFIALACLVVSLLLVSARS